MPYKIRKIRNSNKYTVKNMETGHVAAKSTTRKNAERQVRLLNAIEHGFVPTRRKRKSSNKRR